ncbi:energy-coupling factor transporter transmembrane component T family protein [Paenibacillus koleovorans]|uniref:energy-coupling factor transporter transmembrane component T family protein n=1 Tax=Paenibacillus koleovorans TaxID=121608 RepID=UPI000FD9A6DE|nr:energy-coupling factor transporter transmembrane component T [Paenibacillus koleovorans]
MDNVWTNRETWLHRVNPTLKLAVVFAVFLVVLVQHNLNVLLYGAIVPLALYLTSTGQSWRRLSLFSIPTVVLVLSSMSSMMFYGLGDTTWFEWGLIHISEESFYRGVHIGMKSLHFALIGMLFGLTTKPVVLFYSLMQQLKLPGKYAYSFMAALRLLPMMLSEFQTLRHALIVRGVPPRSSWRAPFATLKAYAVPMLAQSIRRAQRIAVAMEAKRFLLTKERTYYYRIGFSAMDILFLLYWLALGWLVIRLGWHFPIVDNTDVRYTG